MAFLCRFLCFSIFKGETKMKAPNIKNERKIYASRFALWVLGHFIFAIIIITLYLTLLEGSEWLKTLQDNINVPSEKYKDPEHIKAVSFAFSSIAFFAFLYITISLYILLTNKAEEDSRFNSLPFLTSPIFLIIENGLLHLFNNDTGTSNFYTITMTVFSSMVVGVITFSSLKFSFALSAQQKRHSETSNVKPNFFVTKNKNDYSIIISHKEAYLCGAYVGNIRKIFYWDIKRTGNYFTMNKLLFPNRKVLFKHGNIKIIRNSD